MSTKGLIWLFIFAMIIGGTAAGIYYSQTSASSTSSSAMDGMNMEDTSADEHLNHDSSNTSASENDTMSEETPEPSPSPEADITTSQEVSSNSNDTLNGASPSNELINLQPKPGQPVKGFTLTAMESNLQITEGVTLPVWTYNGTVPGQEIRVTQGDFVQVTLKNDLKVPVTIHWHGYPVSSETDGVPGVSQDAVLPGETFTYSFSVDVAGTYWYHSHQESSEQVDKGLYGALIVEPKDTARPDKDYTLLLDEWINPEDASNAQETTGMSGMEGMAGMADTTSMSDEEMMSSMYSLYTVNGKSGAMITPLEAKVGDTVRLRLINAGYRSHAIHIPGEFKVVSTDGQDIEKPTTLQNQLVTVAPGERYDIEFKVSSPEDFTIDAHDDNKYNDQLVIPFKVAGSNGKVKAVQHSDLTGFDLFSYGKPATKAGAAAAETYALEYTAVLNSKMNGDQLVYTINDKVFSDLPALQVKTGDNVKITFINEGEVDHPMHVHGHFFQVLEKNGVKVNSTLMKDTVLVKPGEKIVITFKADNPGSWMIHCHELHHAAAGMAQQLIYSDFVSSYTPDPSKADNKPE
ncbi:multicopper oxidase family protein [Paenibacillus pedocola]|uniref:multicopper oxidase family protein n=1 Tax=Paenibacillus pedocola TaxID=3242193 RepID=UPI002877E085|nr:multicopper oxidase family protein [Paenibacillus typhae]